MAKVTAVTGKGGVGKTTVAALAVRLLVEHGQTPVLAVDADPNLNLNTALGVGVEQTVGDIREEGLTKAAALPGGMAKSEFLRMRVQEALVEREGYDLLAMGRPEGPGCYCFANSVLRACVDQIGRQYAHVVVDCEAGLEHLSRRTAGDIDVLLVLSDESVRSLDTARRVLDLVGSLGTRVGKVAFALTRVRDGVPEEVREAARARGLPDPFLVPEDPQVAARDLAGEPLAGVGGDSVCKQAVEGILTSLGLLPSVPEGVSRTL